MRLIDADVLSESVCFVISNSKELVTSSVVRKAVLSLIDRHPTIKTEPVKHGHWIAYQNGRWIYAKCSECESVQDVQSNYCPSCGARMNGGNA